MEYNHNDLGLSGGSGLPGGNSKGFGEYEHKDPMSSYDKNDYQEHHNSEKKLLMPFMVPFYFLSKEAGIYYHIYRDCTSKLELIFKERVFSNNNAITGITEASIDEFFFAMTKLYQRGAGIVFLISFILTIVASLSASVPILSITLSALLLYVLCASIYVDLWYTSKHYTHASKKFADERMPQTQQFYNNYILNFHLTEKVYLSTLIACWITLFGLFIFKDSIEYFLKFDTGIFTSFAWYGVIIALSIPSILYVAYYYEKEKTINRADMQREELIEVIRNATKTNFDIARQKLKDYK